METKKIDGFAIISEKGDFSFDSGLPQSELIVARQASHRGTATIMQNGSFHFKARTDVPVGTPSMDTILRSDGLIVKRSAKNFIVTMKFPIFEQNVATNTAHKNFWNQAESALKTERNKIKSTF